jgi:ribonucleoside-diphosphate reductase alpha chain
MQAIWQKHVTNSVSKTINLPNEATIEDVANAYMLAWQTDCKAVTVYRDGSKSMQVLETGSDSEKTKMQVAADLHLLVPRQRPVSVVGITDRIRTSTGTMYVTINFDEEGRPFEVFTTHGKAGSVEAAHLEGLSRMISLSLRSGIDPEQIVEQLRGITCEPVWDNGTLVRSAEDAVAIILSRHLRGPNFAQTGAVSTALIDRAEQLGLFPSSQSGSENQLVPSGARCPKCSGYVIHQEGCLRCLDCGYTKCE